MWLFYKLPLLDWVTPLLLRCREYDVSHFIIGGWVIDTQYIKQLPSPSLQKYVSHYWLSRNNLDDTYSVLPDGSVDLVFNVCGGTVDNVVYGTTTAYHELPIQIGSHYLGVCFKPGQSRHFINVPAHRLTDSYELAQGLLSFDTSHIPDQIISDDIFKSLNQVLESHLRKHQPVHSSIDDIVQIIQSNHGLTSISDIAALFGKSKRQFERVFLETVGITAKLFSQIVRFRHASNYVGCSSISLAHIAAASGYTDQSHMNREFKRFANQSPTTYAGQNVVFLQDTLISPTENRFS